MTIAVLEDCTAIHHIMGVSYAYRTVDYDPQSSETMIKNKFCKLENRIFLGRRKLHCDVIMNARSTI
jgi:hypothetical protein